MNQIPDVPGTKENLPNWMPRAARNYIHHTEYGCSIRQLARQAGCHASTVMRQVRGIEARRDDLLVDEALTGIGALARAPGRSDNIEIKDISRMTNQSPRQFTLPAPDKKTIEREGRRILRRLCEPGACLAVARDMEKAVVVRETDAGNTVRTAVVDRPVAQAMALKDWISCAAPGRIMRYKITAVGRAALKRLLAQDDSVRSGFSDGPARFGAQHGDYGLRDVADPQGSGKQRVRYNYSESPVAAMARRKDKAGNPFLSPDLVAAAERLREDFELAQMGPRIAQDWDRFLTGGDRNAYSPNSGAGDGPSAARDRVNAALRDLGPGLGDVALRVCCFLEGLEAAEKRMGWAARSGKVVLRIALQRLRQHYESQGATNLIG